ncbi:MAG: ABC transporter permease [Melioribacteraceae bacterium]|nr:ABC transporter permease [Melioribacteraceae bacterium]MDD3558591.1 ABC transporter permease [Melioribacteraceae bacterium]
MKPESYIAKKFILSNKKSFFSLLSIIAICGIALGVAILISALSILSGFEKSIENKIINFNDHIKITSFDGRDIDSEDSSLSKFAEDQVLKSVTPFLSRNIIIRSQSRSEGVILIGKKNPESLLKGMLTTSKNSSDDVNKIYIGVKLADKLGIKLGDSVIIFGLKKNAFSDFSSPPVVDQLIVDGIYESGMYEYDDQVIYVDLNYSQKLFYAENKISGYDIRLTDISKIELFADNLRDGLQYPYYVRTVFQVYQNIFTWLELQKKPVPIVLGLIILVAAFNVIGSMLMVVMERIKEIGTLKTLGATKKSIRKIFMFQGFVISLLGIIIGNLIALTLTLIQNEYGLIKLPGEIYFLTQVPIELNLFLNTFVSIIAVILSLASAVVPSIIASKINIIKSLRFN